MIGADPFFTSTAGLAIVLAAVFAAVFVIAEMVAGTRARKRHERELRRRIGAISPDVPDRPDAQMVPTGLADAGQRVVGDTGFGERLDLMLERAGMPMRSGEFVALSVLSGLGGAAVMALVVRIPILVAGVAVLAAFIPYLWVKRAEGKRQQLLVDQLADVLAILASSLRAGHSFLQALDMVAKEIGKPSADEYTQVVAEIRLGRPVDEALLAMAERVGSEDLRWAVIAVNIQRQVGGNLAEVLDTVAATVRERAYIRRQIHVLSAEGRLSVGILTVLPIAIALYIAIVNPGYLNLLFTTRIGQIMLVGAVALLVLGVAIMRRMVRIDA